MGQETAVLKVRPAVAADAAPLSELVRGLLVHEGKSRIAHVTPAAVADWLGGPDPVFEALVAILEDVPVGYLAFYRAFSLYKGQSVFLIENLYVAEPARGLGAGRALMAAAAREARRRGFPRLELNVSEGNTHAKRFYRGIGLAAPGEEVYRMEEEAIAKLAGD